MYELFSNEKLFMNELEWLVVKGNFDVVNYQDNRFLELTVVTLINKVTHKIFTVACDYLLDK